MNPYLYKARLSARFWSFLIDIFIMFTLFTMFFSFVFTPIFSKITKIDYYENKITEIRINSHLYKKGTNSNYEFISENIDEGITLFYSELENGKTYLEKYEQAKTESNLFEYSNENGWVEKEVEDKSLLSDFYQSELNKAAKVLNEDEELNRCSYRMIIRRIIVIIVSLIFTYLFYNLVIPLVMKKGQSLGKFICGIRVVDHLGYNVKYRRIVLRCFVGLFFNVILAIFFALPWFISVGMLLFSKNGTTIQDYFSLTYLVDAKESTFFNSLEEQEEFERKKNNKEFKYVHEKGY